MTYRAIKALIVVFACWMVVDHIEDAARYFHIRDLQHPPSDRTLGPSLALEQDERSRQLKAQADSAS